MPRAPYSINSYTGGAIPATLFFSITATGTSITITGTNSTWNNLGTTGGFALAINYGGVNEEKVYVPSGSYNWTSGGVTLSGITRGFDNTTQYLQVAGLSVVPVFSAVENAESNQLVNTVLGNISTSASGQLLTSNGSTLVFSNNPLNTPKSQINYPIFTGTMESVYFTNAAPNGITAMSVSSGSTWFFNANTTANFGINLTASGTMNNLLGIGQSLTASVIVQNAANGYFLTVTGFQIDGVTQLVSGVQSLYWQGGATPASGYGNGLDAYTFTVIKTANATYTTIASQTRF